jgi:CDP-glycerol glycerophosphotransferase
MKIQLKMGIKLLFSPFRKTVIRRNMVYSYFYDLLQIKSDMVLFESYHGRRIGGNPYAIFKQLMNDPDFKDYTFVWVIDDENNDIADQYREMKNVKYVKRHSFKYLKYLCQTKYLVNNSTFPFYFQKKKGQIYVNTWHGTPLKTLGKHIGGKMGQHKNMARNFLYSDYFVHPNKFTIDVLVQSNDLEGLFQGYIVDEGYPRNDLTINASQEQVKAILNKKFNVDTEKKIVLYAPTWRGEIGKPENISRDTYEHVKAMHARLPDGHILLLKVHGLTYRYIREDTSLDDIIIIPDWFETNELLAAVDVLITDYSSIFFDFLVTQRPIIYYAYDLEEYKRKRGMYLDLEGMPGPICRTVDDVMSALRNIDEVHGKYRQKYMDALRTYCYREDGHAAERIVDIAFRGNHTDHVFKLKAEHKKNVLIYAGAFLNREKANSAINYINNMDFSKYNIVVVCSDKVNHKMQNNLQKLSPEVKIIYRMGTLNFKLTQYYRHYLAIRLGIDKKWLSILLPKQLYKQEFLRIVGDANFDMGVDLSGASPYWSLIFKHNFGQDSTPVINEHQTNMTS